MAESLRIAVECTNWSRNIVSHTIFMRFARFLEDGKSFHQNNRQVQNIFSIVENHFFWKLHENWRTFSQTRITLVLIGGASNSIEISKKVWGILPHWNAPCSSLKMGTRYSKIEPGAWGISMGHYAPNFFRDFTGIGCACVRASRPNLFDDLTFRIRIFFLSLIFLEKKKKWEKEIKTSGIFNTLRQFQIIETMERKKVDQFSILFYRMSMEN